MLLNATFSDSRPLSLGQIFRRNDKHLAYFVIPDQAGIRQPLPRFIELLRLSHIAFLRDD